MNPDPRTLWKNIPSDPNGVYAKPDCDKKFYSCGARLSLVGASQRGRSHAQEGKPRDDDFIFDYDEKDDRAILIVADGAGSARFSRRGSFLACQTALATIRAATPSDFWVKLKPHVEKWAQNHDEKIGASIRNGLYSVLVQAAFDARQRIAQEVKEHEARYLATYKKAEKFSIRDYATTLIITLAKKFEFGWFVASYWVGDGGVGIYRPDKNEVLVQGEADGGEYGGQTRFLTEDSDAVWPNDSSRIIDRRIRINVVDTFKAIVLMTDGVTDPKFETDNNLKNIAKWNELWADLEKTVPFARRDTAVAESLLTWLDFWSAGNHDDRTILMLY